MEKVDNCSKPAHLAVGVLVYQSIWHQPNHLLSVLKGKFVNMQSFDPLFNNTKVKKEGEPGNLGRTVAERSRSRGSRKGKENVRRKPGSLDMFGPSQQQMLDPPSSNTGFPACHIDLHCVCEITFIIGSG